jgi:cytochrome b pre-mRNA-processing protein 3
MGYNTRSVTAIRETGNMCGSIVRAVEKDHDFWYGGESDGVLLLLSPDLELGGSSCLVSPLFKECGLPATYQTFFQLHLVYLYLLLPRLRALPNTTTLGRSSTSISQTYQTELLTHFFALAENQMRVTLGQGERERVVRNYMKEMGEQWKGAGIGFDYAISIGQDLPEIPAGERSSKGGDAELAAWVWRNLFAARYSDLPSDFTPTTNTAAIPAEQDTVKSDPSKPVHHLKLPAQLAQIVAFIRRELYRLDQLSDEDIEQGRTGEFGPVREITGRRGGEETVDGA